MSDENTCRICRGEATDEEPLYHPCKCSGSIRYVHQDCLMDWLMHTRKSTNAVCELCSTPFKFSKVYASDMPDTVPVGLIVKKLFFDILGVFGTFARLGLLYVLWIVVCPYISIMTLRFYLSLAETVPNKPSRIGNLYDLIMDLWTLPEDMLVANNASDSTTIQATTTTSSSITQLNGGPPNWGFEKSLVDRILEPLYQIETVYGMPPSLVPWLRKLLNDLFRGQELLVFLCLFVLIFVMVREWILQSSEHIAQQLAREALIQAHETRVALAAAASTSGSANPVASASASASAPAQPQNNGLLDTRDILNHLSNIREIREPPTQAPTNPATPDTPNTTLHTTTNTNNANANTNTNTTGGEDESTTRRVPPEHVRAAIDRMNEQMRDPALLDRFNAPPERNETEENVAVRRTPEQVRVAIERMNEQMRDAALLERFNMPPEEDEVDDLDEDLGIIDFLFNNKGFSTIITVSIAGNLLMTIVNFFLFFVPYLVGRILLLYVYWVLAPRVHAFITGGYYGLYYIWESLILHLEQFTNISGVSSELHASNINWGKNMMLQYTSNYNVAWEVPQTGTFIRVTATAVGYAVYIGVVVICANSVSIPYASPSTTRVIIGLCGQIQAILKVMTIVGIELVVFPIFSGILLKFAFLPIFKNITLWDAVMFTMNSPVLSTLIHWVLGTIYMVLFAMFVTVCRKLMRPGVLFFIRDPKDPTFHPIGDILERPLRSQLHKIGLSGLIYTVLILVCLGSGVQLARASGILPLNFEVNLTGSMMAEILLSLSCMQTFLPEYISVCDKLECVSKVWKVIFAKSCKILRLSSFILGETHNDEIVVRQGKVNEKHLTDPDPEATERIVTAAQLKDYCNSDTVDVRWPSNQICLVTDGYFVRAPAIDRIPINNKLKLFTPVDAEDRPLDKPLGHPVSMSDNELTDYVLVFRPPHFKLRVMGLLLNIWFFGVVLCTALAVSPLIFGRLLVRLIFPAQVYDGMNDMMFILYGIPISIFTLYLLENWRDVLNTTRERISRVSRQPNGVSLLGFGLAAVTFGPYMLGMVVKHQVYESFLSQPVEAEPYIFEDTQFLRQSFLGLMVLAFGRLMYRLSPENRLKVFFREFKDNLWIRNDWSRLWKNNLFPLLRIYVEFDALPLLLSRFLTRLFYDENPTKSESLRILLFETPKLLAFLIFISKILIKKLSGFATSARDSAYLVGQQLENM